MFGVHCLQVVEALYRDHVEVLVDELVVVDVRIAEAEHCSIGPAEPGEVNDRAVLASPQRAGFFVDGAVSSKDRDGVLDGGHGPGLVIDDVARR